MKIKYLVRGRVRLISQARGEQLTKPEEFRQEVMVDDFIHQAADSHPDILRATVESNCRMALVDVFVGRLKEDRLFKRSMGRTKWSIDLVDYTYRREMAEDAV